MMKNKNPYPDSHEIRSAAVRRGFDNFHALQLRFADVGAFDTEADTFFQRIISCAIVGERLTQPPSHFAKGDWALFSTHPLREACAIALSTAALQLYEAVRHASAKTKAQVRGILWRIDWEDHDFAMMLAQGTSQ